MKRPIRWTEPARLDLRRILAWLEQSIGREQAEAEARQILSGCAQLQTRSRLGTPVGRKCTGGKDIRCLAMAPHHFHYALTEEEVVILRIRHSGEDPDQLVELP